MMNKKSIASVLGLVAVVFLGQNAFATCPLDTSCESPYSITVNDETQNHGIKNVIIGFTGDSCLVNNGDKIPQGGSATWNNGCNDSSSPTAFTNYSSFDFTGGGHKNICSGKITSTTVYDSYAFNVYGVSSKMPDTDSSSVSNINLNGTKDGDKFFTLTIQGCTNGTCTDIATNVSCY